MDINLRPGKYVVGVSGGVDSIALLDVLHRKKLEAGQSWRFIVAHFDHGIREDSSEDRRLVQTVARNYGLPFVYDEGQLGAGSSEATARSARYKFLRRTREASGAHAIVTAHHQDDLLETAILNLLRGTGRKGLTALSNQPDVARPLLHIPKAQLIGYAQDQGLRWREDSTNSDQRYLRNYIRHTLLPRFDENAREQLRQIITRLQVVNHELDTLLVNQLHVQSVAGCLDRRWFNHLPHDVAKETMASWLRAHDLARFDSKMLQRLVIAAKTAEAGKLFPVLNGQHLRVGKDYLALGVLER